MGQKRLLQTLLIKRDFFLNRAFVMFCMLTTSFPRLTLNPDTKIQKGIDGLLALDSDRKKQDVVCVPMRHISIQVKMC